jgi:hypothetical protein
MAGAGEWQELVDLVVASLGLTRAPVTAVERDELQYLLTAMDLSDNAISALNVKS